MSVKSEASEEGVKEGAVHLDIRAEAGEELAQWMSEVLETPFFSRIVGEGGEIALLQSMRLMDNKDSGQDYSPLVDYIGMAGYCHEAGDSYTAKKKGIIKCLAEYLSDAFPEGSVRIKAEDVPMLVLFSDTAMRHGIAPDAFGEFVMSLAKMGE